jgi:hypothetical protein
MTVVKDKGDSTYTTLEFTKKKTTITTQEKYLKDVIQGRFSQSEKI